MDTTRSESFDNSSRTTVSTDSEGNSSPVEQQKANEAQKSNDGVDYAAFGKEIQAVRRRIQQKMGQEDIDYIRDVIKTSRSLEVIGRGLLHAGKGPLSFLGGTLSLWVHKQLEAMEIGHTVLHGAYNNFENNEGLDSDDFYWRVPIHEESWKHGHNVMHHRHTNIAGKDPDLEFGVIRLDDKIKWRPAHALQLPLTLFMVFPNFTFWMNWHFTGLTDVYLNKDRLDVLDELNWESIKEAHKKTLESYAKHYGYEYVLWPLLAGWNAPRVLAGNVLTEVLRDVYAAATIFCGHIGEETATYETDESARGRGQWYAMQVESANNFDVPKPISIMCGALDLQIEHHLFPEFPPNRLREIQPEIQEICERHGVEYRMDTWPKTLWGAFKKIARLSKESGGNPFRATSAVAADMT